MEAGEDQSDQASSTPAFMLAPVNREARRVVEHSRNQYSRSGWQQHHRGALDIVRGSREAIHHLGRKECDIFIPEYQKGKVTSEISDFQASFHVVESTGAVILTDRRPGATPSPWPVSIAERHPVPRQQTLRHRRPRHQRRLAAGPRQVVSVRDQRTSDDYTTSQERSTHTSSGRGSLA